MTLSKYIRDLLYRYECVIIPEFGGFLTKTISAQIDEKSSTLHPPSKRLGFNSQLKENDGLLANYIASVDKVSYETATNFIELEVKKWQEKLVNKDVVLEEVGTFSLNNDKNIVFEPDPNANFLTDSFGLTSIVAPTVFRADYMNEEVVYESISDTLSAEEIYVNSDKIKRRIGPFLRYAATFAILLTIGYFLGKQIINNNKLGRQVAEMEEDQESLLNTRIQEATFEINKTLPAITLKAKTALDSEYENNQVSSENELSDKVNGEEVVEAETTSNEAIQTESKTLETETPTNITSSDKYHIIAGAFGEKSNATRLVTKLKTKGYDAHIVGVNRRQLTSVAFGSFATMEEAKVFLKEIRKTEAKDAWILVK